MRTLEDFDIYSIASATPRVEIANPKRNAEFIVEELGKPELSNTSVVVFPELCISGYTCADLFLQDNLIKECQSAVADLCIKLSNDERLIAVGTPVIFKGRLYNCAIIICKGNILGIVPKTFIPNYQEFYEKRWFASGADITDELTVYAGQTTEFGTSLIFEHLGMKVGVEICEDLWVPVPPSCLLCQAGSDVILNLSATDDNIGKYDYIRRLVESQSSRCRCVYAYSSAGRGESSTDLVFSGINIVACDGIILSESKRFSKDATTAVGYADIEKLRNERRKYSTFCPDHTSAVDNIKVLSSSSAKAGRNEIPGEFRVNPHPFIPEDKTKRNESCSEIIDIQTWGLDRRLEATGCKNLIIGISGGLDSTLALLVAHHTFLKAGLDPKGIIAVTMPAEATSERTHSNAWKLMQELGVTPLEIPVKAAVDQHFKDIDHNPEIFDAVYENSQARERTQILMDLANKYRGMVLGTGDMSELALGWCTYNGDHMSMYNVNGGVPKTLVRHLVGWFADNTENGALREVLTDIIDTPISPELIPAKSKEEIAQKTEDLVGPYELHDFFLFHFLRNGSRPAKIMMLASVAFQGKYSEEELKKWLVNFFRRFFSQQFKRSCMPDGPKIGSVCLSPRGDWRMPSDASAAIWIKEAEAL